LQFIEAPAESGPNTVAVKSRDGALGLLMVFNASTHLPERLRYRLEATAGSIAIEKEILYQDYRDVGGRQVPFKLVMSPVVAPAAGPRTIQEYVVSDVKVNTAIDPKVFRR
jgi:hypothetical protein